MPGVFLSHVHLTFLRVSHRIWIPTRFQLDWLTSEPQISSSLALVLQITTRYLAILFDLRPHGIAQAGLELTMEIRQALNPQRSAFFCFPSTEIKGVLNLVSESLFTWMLEMGLKSSCLFG